MQIVPSADFALERRLIRIGTPSHLRSCARWCTNARQVCFETKGKETEKRVGRKRETHRTLLHAHTWQTIQKGEAAKPTLLCI